MLQMYGKSNLPRLPEEVIEKILYYVPPYMRKDAVHVGEFVLVATSPESMYSNPICILMIEFIEQSVEETRRNGLGLAPGWLGWAYGPMDEIHDKSSSSVIINSRIVLDFAMKKERSIVYWKSQNLIKSEIARVTRHKEKRIYR